jgi:hypothetical protein
VDHAAAEKAVGIILNFLDREGPADKVPPLLAKLPGADALMQKAASESGPMGGTMGGVIGAGMRLMSAGSSVGQVRGDDKVVIACARRKTGEDTVGQIVGAVPGLAAFV